MIRARRVGMANPARAEDLEVVHNLIVNKEQRVPDIAYFNDGKPDPASTSRTLILHGQEFHTSYWGHMGLLGLKRNILLPDYAGYPNTAVASLYPTNAMISDLTRAQGGLVGYVHFFYTVPDPTKEKLTNALPVDAALGKVDYYEVIGFADVVPRMHLRAGSDREANVNFVREFTNDSQATSVVCRKMERL
jgi:TolB protein